MTSEADKAVAELAAARLAGEDIATSIERIAAAGEALLNTGLKKRTLILLIHDITGLPRGAINKVLDAFVVLPDKYLEKPDD